MKSCISFFIFCILTFVVVRDASAIVEYEGENSTFTMRMALDVGGGANFNPDPDLLYKDDKEPLFFAGLRVLMDSFIGEHLRFEFNGYQNGYTMFDLEANSSFAKPYRSRYLNHDWLDSDKGRMVMALDQISLRIFAGPVDITIGRQPIGLSNNFIFTPNDFFYPFGSTAVDREFRPGVDAFRLDARIGMLSRLNLYAVMGYDSESEKPEFDRSAFLARFGMNTGGVDWTLLGGKVAERYLGGFALSGEFDFMGYRAEANVSFPDADFDKAYFNIAAGFDKRFENTFHIMLEYYWHQNGETDASQYLNKLINGYDVADPFLGEHYIGLAMSGELLPVLIMQGTILMNVTDPSVVLSPALTWSAAEEVDFILSASIPIGKWAKADLPAFQIQSEYGTYPFSVQIQGRWYF